MVMKAVSNGEAVLKILSALGLEDKNVMTLEINGMEIVNLDNADKHIEIKVTKLIDSDACSS